MPLQSALEDFERISLGAIPGLLRKLRYLAELHDGHGSYSHWGMGRVHGEAAARRAIRSSHAAILTAVLRTPLRVLAEELSSVAESGDVTALALLSSLETLADQIIPDRSLTATEKHLKAVLRALSALLQSQARATRPEASPPPLPVR